MRVGGRGVESKELARIKWELSADTRYECNICGLLTRMYFFVQIERALLREGLEADGALERPLACAAVRGERATGGQRNKTKPRWTNNSSTVPIGLYSSFQLL